ncbi:hypothetical protein BKA65DRAFT_485829 [Rhexocercosporidium sp. MPI-PUGE-AT-0058]|nr:hypothetical protein BKA65DRAFT_485829 [Rhexocercosporidium sp. MPI-PUGE-AT-0058]
MAGLSPLEPGWTRWKVQPVLAGLENVDVSLSSPAGQIEISLRMQEHFGTGIIVLAVPSGYVTEVFAPLGWHIAVSDRKPEPPPTFRSIPGEKSRVTLKIELSPLGISQLVANREQTRAVKPSGSASGKAPVGGWYGKFSILRLLLKWLS